MSTFSFQFAEGEPDAEALKILTAGMLAYHAGQGHPRQEDTFSIFIKDKDGKTVGGIILGVLWQRMKINSLWVDESQRGQGLGTRLMRLAEAEAIKRGCTHAYTDTFTWQAPEFYKKLGYEVYGELKDFPPGNSLIYVSKKLKG